MLDGGDAEWTAQKIGGPEFERKQGAVRLYAVVSELKNGQ